MTISRCRDLSWRLSTQHNIVVQSSNGSVFVVHCQPSNTDNLDFQSLAPRGCRIFDSRLLNRKFLLQNTTFNCFLATVRRQLRNCHNKIPEYPCIAEYHVKNAGAQIAFRLDLCRVGTCFRRLQNTCLVGRSSDGGWDEGASLDLMPTTHMAVVVGDDHAHAHVGHTDTHKTHTRHTNTAINRDDNNR